MQREQYTLTLEGAGQTSSGGVRRLLQVFLWILATVVLIWALNASAFRDQEGVLSGNVCAPISIAVAFLMLGAASRTKLLRTAFWFSLATIGQACALQMIDAGSRLHYQHYFPIHRLAVDFPVYLAIVILQSIAVGYSFATHWREAYYWLRQRLRIWQILGIWTFWQLWGATVSPSAYKFVAELVFSTLVQSINLGNIILILWSIPDEVIFRVREKCKQLFGVNDDSSERYMGLDRFALICAGLTTIVTAALALLVYERHPHIPDEVAYLFQAHTFAAGKLALAAPSVSDAFKLFLIEQKGGSWYSVFPPGWPAMLAIGVKVGAAWIINPVLSGVNILLSYVLVRALYTRGVARVAILLLCVSPWFLFLGMSFMSHMFALTCALLATLGVELARRSARSIWAWGAGAALGMVSLIRPLEGFIVAILLGVWSIGLGGRRLKFSGICGLVLGSMLVGALVLPYNQRLTGKARVFPVMAYFDEHFHPHANALGFGPDRGMGWGIDPQPGHDLVDAAINADLNTFSINTDLFGWSIGSLFLIGLFIFAGKKQGSDYLMIALVSATFIAHIFYYFSGGPEFGARYWFLMIIPCVVLSARGVIWLESRFSLDCPNLAGRATIGVVLLVTMALINFFPWRAVDKYHHLRGMRPDIRYLAKEHRFGDSLVLVRGEEFPDYASAAVYNPLNIHSHAPVYVRDVNSDVRQEILGAYADRPIWIVNGPSITGVGFEVIAGPLSRAELTTR